MLDLTVVRVDLTFASWCPKPTRYYLTPRRRPFTIGTATLDSRVVAAVTQVVALVTSADSVDLVDLVDLVRGPWYDCYQRSVAEE